MAGNNLKSALLLLFICLPLSALVNIRIVTPENGSQPFTTGQAFRMGDVPSGTSITAHDIPFQADVRNLWRDGSVRFAVLSGVAPAGTVTINAGGSAYSAPDVEEPSVEAVAAFSNVVDAAGSVVAGGSFSASLASARNAGSAAWSRTAAHKVREIKGPVMSEFHYFVPTADTHTHVWFYVRAYSTGHIEVETVVENGWLKVASPGKRTYDMSLTIAGTVRLDTTGVAHFHHTRWSRADWAAADPRTTVTHDPAYLQNTGLVPAIAVSGLAANAYTTRPESGPKHAVYTRTLAEQPTLFGRANIDPNLGAGGDTDMYGILPGWGMTYLAEAHTGAFWACVANGRAQGRYSLHYRDETDGRPFRGSANLTTGLNGNSSDHGVSEISGSWTAPVPTPSGGYCGMWTFTHSPAAAYAAALLTGRWLFIEEVQFTVGTGEMDMSTTRNGFRALAWWQQNRGNGWKTRDRFQAEAVTPACLNGIPVSGGPDSSQRAEAVGRVTAMIDQHYDYYISGTSTSAPSCARGNAFGLPYQNADFDFTGNPNNDGEHGYGGLQNGIYITNWLYGFDMQPLIPQPDREKLCSLAAFFGKFPVGMLGAAPNGSAWNWRVFGFVTLGFGTPGATSPGDDAGGRTVYRNSWDANWARLQEGAPYNWDPGTFPVSTTDNTLRKIQMNGLTGNLTLSVRSAFTADTDLEALCWAANYAHKIADRVRIPGADTAIGRLHGSDTWKHGMANLFLTRPEFAVTSNRIAGSALELQVTTDSGPLSLSALPNPCLGTLTAGINGSKTADRMALYDTRGRLVKSARGPVSNVRWDISGLTAGIYVLKAVSGRYTVALRLIKL